MTDAPSPPASPRPIGSGTDPLQYWCYHCEKRVAVETEPEIVCHECNNGFVETIPATSPLTSPSAAPPSSDFIDDPSFGSQFLQVLRLIAQASSREESRDDDAPPPPPPDAVSEGDDYLRIELDGWDNDDDNDDDGENDFEFPSGVEPEDGEQENGLQSVNGVNGENDRGRDEFEEEDEEEEDRRRRRRDVVRLRIRDMTARARTGRNRLLDWAEILMGLEDNSIEFRVEMPEQYGYVGNPEDYVDAAGYEALLQNLAESDQNGRRGAPPAAKSAVLALPTVAIQSEEERLVCAICKDGVNVGETAKKLPCGHGYHGDCIEPWLESRNSCPVCRFELPTDDPEYEEEKNKRFAANVNGASGSA